MELYQERIEKALAYIEENLTASLTLENVANSAHYSKFHFMRIFKAIAGDTLGDYIRKRRISESAIELVAGSESILNIALKYQFESQESFTRSFQSVFEVAPGFYRKRGYKYVGFEKYKLSEVQHREIQNFIIMEPRIVTIQDRKLVGMNIVSSMAGKNIAELWKEFMPRRKEIKHIANSFYYSVQSYDETLSFETFDEHTVFERWAALEVTEFTEIPSGMKKHMLQGGQYAVFSHKGPVSTFQKTATYIHQEWLPASEFVLDNRNHFEILGEKYYGPNHPNSEEDVWIPIKEKE